MTSNKIMFWRLEQFLKRIYHFELLKYVSVSVFLSCVSIQLKSLTYYICEILNVTHLLYHVKTIGKGSIDDYVHADQPFKKCVLYYENTRCVSLWTFIF